MKTRRQTAGDFDFEDIVNRGAILSDKTELMYQMVDEYKYVFLSRPRRFGKSLLCSMLKHYFLGHKDLFANFKIAELEKDWIEYPVMSFTMSSLKHCNAEEVKEMLNLKLDDYEEIYKTECSIKSPGARFTKLIRKAHIQTGKKVVIIIDEYDAPLLETERTDDENRQVHRAMLDFYQQLKDNIEHIRFVFLTGITKFSNLSIFSSLNNLNNISMTDKYATICGITQSELETTFRPDVEALAEKEGVTYDEMLAQLKFHYDGYRFTETQPEEIYNPFSLTLSFQNKKIKNYWFSSGTPSYLIPFLKKYSMDITSMQDMNVSASQFDVSLDAMQTALPLLYQSGYLTIKNYIQEVDRYVLDFPNSEVKTGFMECILSELLNVNKDTHGLAYDFYFSLLHHNIDEALQHLKAYFAGIPYLQHGNKALDDITTFEAYYQTLFYVVFSIFSCKIRTEVHTALGSADIVFEMPDAIYVMEIKLCTKDDASNAIEDALEQIEAKGYATAHEKPGTKVIRIGVAFARETRTLEKWKIVE